MAAPGSIWQDRDWPDGWVVRHIAETTSTNTVLLAALDNGQAGDHTVLVTDHQTAGRGRLDRRWETPAGTNLLMSIAFTDVPKRPSELTHRVALAAVDAVRLFDTGSVALKWPNDVLLDGLKLAGILAQRSSVNGAVVVGLGLNIAWAPVGAARMQRDGNERVPSPAALTVAILHAFDQLPTDVTARYRAELATLGAHVRVELPGGATLVGVATDVDEAGRLTVLGGDGVVHVLDVGDVVHASIDV